MVNEKEIAAVIKLLDDPDELIYNQIEQKILSYGSLVISYLENAWAQSFDAILQKRIENLVHKIQFNDVKQDLALWHYGGNFDLLRGILVINKYQYPDLDEQKIINQIEAIKREIWLQLIYETSPAETVKIMNNVFYNLYRFSGNTLNHQDPQNSYISQVLESKKGNQISLAIIYAIIAQKLDIPIYGVNLPQHFILAYMDETQNNQSQAAVLFYINTFNKGYTFAKQDIDQFLRQLQIQPSPHFYQPCSNVEIIKRVLRNLIASYQKAGLNYKAKEMEELLDILA
jgi:regulator of sirC expression with transglutaminase-like and TPR domain